MSGTLYLVGTPIGNLGDLTERARETLGSVDLVAAEDTRRAGRLLARLGIDARTISFFEGNEERRAPQLLQRLREGERVALISDAGMPGLSDPGYRLVRGCVEAGIDVRVIPGPSASVSALVLSGLPTDRFVFEGFLPRRTGDRRARLRALADLPHTLVLFESPRRVAALLRELIDELGDRRVAIARELTKRHEEVLRGTASELLEVLGERELRGETVVVIEGARDRRPDVLDLDHLVKEARTLVRRGLRKRAAAAGVAHAHGGSANAIYRRLLEDERDGRD
ncbi:MAG TPA: 16S rRNA (cytidine(1402)-2'-O)-methyltransferase [Actinomycetota bacterium]|nr:16S rRNA (cytidine(1402)-2'-O)-methyltransferase [Actinomycetota bacterium]